METLACLAIAKALVMDKVDWYSKDLGAYPEIVSYIVDNEAKKE